MHWKIKSSDKDSNDVVAEIKVPCLSQEWGTASIDGQEKKYRYNPKLLSLATKDSKPAKGLQLERIQRIRSSKWELKSGEVFFQLENSETAIVGSMTPDVPGQENREKNKKSTGSTLESPMTGKILTLEVENGSKVAKGDLLVVIEAMKMENKILAEEDGVIEQCSIKPGQMVSVGELLCSIKK